MMSRIRRLSALLLIVLGCAGHAAPASPQPTDAPRSKGLVHVSQTGEKQVYPVRVVSVGISDFANLGTDDDLRSGESDAKWFVDQLSRVVDLEEKVVLTGKSATLSKVESEVTRVVGGAGPSDVVMLYFSTQGATQHNKGYLFTYDTIPEGRLPATALSTEKVKAAIKSSKAHQVLVLADAVHQTIKGASGFSSGPDSQVDAVIGAMSDARKDVLVLSGGQVAPPPGDPCQGHGLFTCSVVAALQGRADLNHDGVSDLAELVTTVPGAVASADKASSSKNRVEATGDVSASLGVPVIASIQTEAPKPVTDMTTTVIKDVRVCYLSDNGPVPVDHVFHDNDLFSVRVTAPETGELAMIDVGSDGVPHPLFPWRNEDSRIYQGTSKQVMPADSDDPIRFIPPAGDEKVYVLWRPESEGPFDNATLLSIASERARAGDLASAAEPDQRWRGATKSLGHLSEVSTASSRMNANISTTPAPGSSETCNVYRPEKQGQGWVVELSLHHQ